MSSVVTIMAVSTVETGTAKSAVENVLANAVAITARIIEELSCEQPMTPGIVTMWPNIWKTDTRI